MKSNFFSDSSSDTGSYRLLQLQLQLQKHTMNTSEISVTGAPGEWFRMRVLKHIYGALEACRKHQFLLGIWRIWTQKTTKP